MPERGGGLVPPALSRCLGSRSGKGRHGIGPCLDESQDSVVAVRGDADLIAGEGHVVELSGKVAAPQGDLIGLSLGVDRRVAAHRGRHLGVGGELGLHGGEGRSGRCRHADLSDGLSVVVLVEDAGYVDLSGDGHRVHCDTALLVGGAPKLVGGDDRIRDGLDRGCVCNRCGQLAECGLGDALLNKVCHSGCFCP